MRRLNLILLLSAVTGGAGVCHFLQGDKCGTVGKDVRRMGQHGRRAPLHPLGKDGRYRVTVMHTGTTRAAVKRRPYLVGKREGVLFIETGFAVVVDYDRRKTASGCRRAESTGRKN